MTNPSPNTEPAGADPFGLPTGILQCPKSGAALRPATAEELARAGLESGCATEDGRFIYPVAGGIPRLVPEEARPLAP